MHHIFLDGDSEVALVVKNLPASARDVTDMGLIPGLERSPGGGIGIHSSILPGESADRGAWQVAVCGVTKSWETTECLSTHTYTLSIYI